MDGREGMKRMMNCWSRFSKEWMKGRLWGLNGCRFIGFFAR